MRGRGYPIVIERTSTGFSAYSPDVPGCASVGDTEEETRGNFREALVPAQESLELYERLNNDAYAALQLISMADSTIQCMIE